MINSEELIKAVNLLKENCDNQEGCIRCPFSVNNDCKLTDSSPHYWKIEETPIFKIML